MSYFPFDAIVIYHFDGMNHPGESVLQSSDSADVLSTGQMISVGTKKLFVTGMLLMLRTFLVEPLKLRIAMF